MDLQRDAERLATIATVFVWVGWLFVLYAVIAGVLWWIDLASRANVNLLEAFAISSAAIGGPLFLALLVAGLGHFLRLFAAVRGQLQRVQVAAGRDPMLIRRFLALAAIAVAVAACSSGNTADATADGSGGELQATDLGAGLLFRERGRSPSSRQDQYADADFRAHRVTGLRWLQRLRRRLRQQRPAPPRRHAARRP